MGLMILDMDTIQFESRSEVSNIFNALEEFLVWRSRSDYSENMVDDVRMLKNKLEIMEMNW